jgi:hypothetical protein
MFPAARQPACPLLHHDSLKCSSFLSDYSKSTAGFIIMSEAEQIRIREDDLNSTEGKVLCGMYVYDVTVISKTYPPIVIDFSLKLS